MTAKHPDLHQLGIIFPNHQGNVINTVTVSNGIIRTMSAYRKVNVTNSKITSKY